MISLKRVVKSFVYASRGLAKAFHTEQNLKLETLIGLAVMLAAWLVKVSAVEAAILLLTIGFVLVTEMVNSAVELVSDVIKPRLDHYVKEIKDLMAAAVVLSAGTAILVGLLIFYRHLF